MSERGNFRGGGRGQSRGGRGHDRGGRGAAHSGRDQQEKPKKENILDLTKYLHKQVQVKFNGGREGMPMDQLLGMMLIHTVVGTLEGYDQLMNLVLDHVKETMRGMLGNTNIVAHPD